ncbi:PAS domain S-box protein [Maridesulfovibrio sp. FT414]|uniref:PAS domain S-box protein n=1 Tax=Maridesulfovibrio sp. FT414 TaxID=2979469 RepID=UPI003D8010A1
MDSSLETIRKLFADSKMCRMFLEASPDAIVVIAANGDLVAYNENAMKLFGYSGEDTIPGNVLPFYSDPAQRGNLLSALLENGIVRDFETSLLSMDRGPILASVNVSLLELGGEKVHIAIIRDITERRLAEEKLRKSEEKFSSLFEAASDAILLLDADGRIVDCNKAATKLFILSRQELLDSSFMDLSPVVQPGGRVSGEVFISVMVEVLDGHSKRLLWQYRLKGGTLLDGNISLKAVEVDQKQRVMCVVQDLGEQQNILARGRLDEIRFEALSAISRMGGAALTSIYDYALEAAVSVTESDIGYIYFLNEDETELTLHAWSRNVMPQCLVENVPASYRVEDTGLWGDAVRMRQPVITNDYATCPNKKGVPNGHIPVIRHMNVPLFDGDRIVLLAGVGNKESDYTQEDVRQLTMLMEGMWNVVRRKQADDALMAAYVGLERKVFDRTEKLSLALANLKYKNAEINREIEYRREVEKQLKKSSGRLSLATRAGGLGVWEWELTEGRLVWDDRMFEIYQCSPGEFEGIYEAWRSRVHPDDLACTEMALSDAIEGDGHFDWEFRILWPGGEVRNIKASALGLPDRMGRIQSMIGINEDITERRRLEERLRRFERIIAVTPDMVSLVDDEYKYVMVNDAYVNSFGQPREYFIGRPLAEVVGDDVYEKYCRLKLEAAFSGEIQAFEAWLDIPALGVRFLSVIYQPISSYDGGEQFVAIVAHDITAVRMAEEDRKHIFELSLDLLCVTDLEGRFVELNPAWKNILGWEEQRLKGKFWIDYVHPEDRESSVESMKRLLSGLEIRNFENRYRCSDGSWRWIDWSLNVDMDRGKVTAVARDVSERKAMVDELKRMASTDVLTGANNRRCFLDRSKEEIDRFVRYGGSLALLMLDIDHFKIINDTYGHDAGDEVLKELVRCSRETLRTSDIFGRIGGEEFAALLVQGNIQSSMQAAERLRKSLEELEVRVGGQVIRFTVSIGLTMICMDNPSIEEALKQADRCLYRAKNEGRNRVVGNCG